MARMINSSTATPATTPPAIAPTFVELLLPALAVSLPAPAAVAELVGAALLVVATSLVGGADASLVDGGAEELSIDGSAEDEATTV